MLAGMGQNRYGGSSGLDRILVAAVSGDTSQLVQILDEGVDVNIQNEIGQTPLLAASLGNHSETCRILLDRGANIDHYDIGGYTAFHLTSSVKVLELLLNHPSICGKSKTIVNMKTKKGRMALHEASLHGPLERLDFLITHNALVNTEDSDQATPLHYAACALGSDHSLDALELLLQAGAYVNCQNNCLKTPLILACAQKTMGVGVAGIKLLLKSGADPSLTDIDGNNALHACLHGLDFANTDVPVDVIDNLFETAPEILNTTNRYGEYPIHVAFIGRENSETIRHLINIGADVNRADALGRTVLHLSCQYNILNGPEFLSEHSNLINEVDCLGRTILHYSVLFSSNATFVKEVFHHKSFRKVYHKDLFGFTAIDYALKSKIASIREIFIDKRKEDHKTVNFQTESVSNDEVKPDLRQLLPPMEVETFKDILPASLRPVSDAGSYIHDLWEAGPSPTKNPELFDECKDIVEKFMNKVVAFMQEEDERFSGFLIRNGSSFEGTKIGSADEYDFLLQLDGLSQLCRPLATANDPPGYVRIQRKPDQDLGKYADFFEPEGFLNCRKIMFWFSQLVMQILHNPLLWQNSGIDFVPYFTVHWKDRPAFTISCTQRVPCTIFGLSIDFLPALHFKGWWPNGTRDYVKGQNNLLKEVGCHMIIKPADVPHYQHARFGIPRHFLRITFSAAETVILKSAPTYVRKSFMVAKTAVNRNVKIPFGLVWEDHAMKNAKGRFLVKNMINSYFMKQCLLNEIIKQVPEPSSSVEEEHIKLVTWVHAIFRNVCKAYEEGHLPSAFIPDLNLLHTYKPDQAVERGRCILFQLMSLSLSQDNTPTTITRGVLKQRATSEFEISMHRKFKTLKRLLQGPEERS